MPRSCHPPAPRGPRRVGPCPPTPPPPPTPPRRPRRGGRERHVESRAELLPEELAAGSDDPQAQAEAILAESLERTEHPDADASSQSRHATSEEAARRGDPDGA